MCKWNCGVSVGVGVYGKLVQAEPRFGARCRARRLIREGADPSPRVWHDWWMVLGGQAVGWGNAQTQVGGGGF